MSEELENWLSWRDQMRQKHRVMNLGEYRAWCFAGDAISSPTCSSSFPGGLTITLDKPAIIGRIE
jgi:hypothetical protein